MSSRVLSIVSFVVGIALIATAIYFFLESLTYIQTPASDVVSGLLAAVFGFVTLSAGTTLIRSYLISRVAERK